MKVPCRWLADYVDIDVSEKGVSHLAERLTLAGLEVEAMERSGRVEGAIVGRVLSHKPHPNSDHLSICVVDRGTEEVELVCGAANVVDGRTVPVVGVGGKLPGGLVIEERDIRGVPSPGMICSKAELGLEQSSGGIWNFEESLRLEPGTDLMDLLEFDDYVLDIKVTSNRPDCMGIYGIAREVAAVMKVPLHQPSDSFATSDLPAGDSFQVEIDDPTDTPRYTVTYMSGIQIGASPLKLQHRLLKAGMRPLSNVVDVTNYVMLELGYPLHAFDADRLAGRILVRRARLGERFQTLDGVERELSADVLMITDNDGGLAIAGVMGGERSEITDGTRNVLLEAACFNPVTIRRSARSTAIRSEASQRFERGVDPEGIPGAAARTTNMLQGLLECKVHSRMVDAYPEKRERKEIRFRPSRAGRLLGAEFSAPKAAEILGRLGIEVDGEGDELLARVPTYRSDLTREVDLIEEVGRINGYDELPSAPPRAVLHIGKKESIELYKDSVRGILCGLGLDEVITGGFDDEKWRNALRLEDDDLLGIRNPMTTGQKALRRSLLPGILSVIEANLSRRVVGGMIFEMGRIFSASHGETESLAGALFGRRGIPLGGKEEHDLLTAKGILGGLWSSLGLNEVEIDTDKIPGSLREGCGGWITLNGDRVGILGEATPSVYGHLPTLSRVILFDMDLNKLHSFARPERLFRSLPRFPASLRDLSVIAPIDLPEREIRQVIGSEDAVERVLLYDLYSGDQVASGYRSLTYEVTLRDLRRTLTDEQVASTISSIEKRLRKLGVELRAQRG